MKVRQIMKQLIAEGWYVARRKGSRRQYKHPAKPGLVTVSGKPSDDVHPDTLHDLYRQAGWGRP